MQAKGQWLVVVALYIVFVVALVIVTFCIVSVLVTSQVVVVSIIDNKWSTGGLLGYVCHGYNAIVVVFFVGMEFVDVGVY